MAEQTGIEWCDATFNPWWGCERVSPGCAHCYADTLATRYGFGDTWGDGHGFRFFGDKHWDEPMKWARTLPAKLGRRPRVFCASMADVFEERDELDEHRDRLFSLINETPQLDWLILTKRPEAARDYLVDACSYAGRWEFNDYAHDGQPLPNVWLGVSIENARFTWRADVLREIPAAVRFISAEPLLGSLFDATPCTCPDDWTHFPFHHADCKLLARAPRDRKSPLDLTGIDWVIVGGESGPKARSFHLEHAREILRASYAMRHHERPALFVKQLGARPRGAHIENDVLGVFHEQPLKLRNRKGGDWGEWPADLRIREFPRSAA